MCDHRARGTPRRRQHAECPPARIRVTARRDRTPDRRPSGRNPRRMSTLVIDDEVFVRKLLAHLLGRLGVTEVLACEGGRDALALLDERPDIDLIFLDLQMPGMDGVEFIRHLVSRQYHGALVLVSGEDERILHTAGRLARAHRLDVLGEIRKPVSPDALREVLARRGTQTVTPQPGQRREYDADALRVAITEGQLINHYQ